MTAQLIFKISCTTDLQVTCSLSYLVFLVKDRNFFKRPQRIKPIRPQCPKI